MRCAVIDCGTNTIRLYVADPGPVELTRQVELVRLGQGVDATRTFHPDALARTFAVVDRYAATIRDLGVDRVRFLATSAARDVTNRDELFHGVKERLGVDVEVISGEEEARLSFLGALSGGPVEPGKVVVMDIGGGSTEVIVGEADGTLISATSLDVGSVRLRERFLHGDPPTPDEVAAARGFVRGLLAAAGDLSDVLTWIGVAGTCTSLAAIVHGLTTTYDRAVVHNSTIQAVVVHRLADHLLATPVAEVLAAYPMLEPMRAEVICAGALIVSEAAAALGDASLVVRETDILDGAMNSLLAEEIWHA